jgi:MFS superfamily sulfate permease-like transporter
MENNLTTPKSGFAGFKENFKADIISGFLVFLIALPLCLGISLASGFPPIAGIFTAIIGGLIVPFIAGNNAQLTIKGPAAGLIVIAVGAVSALGEGDLSMGYKYALAVVVAAGIIQIIFGLLKIGSFSDFFPLSVVHGMLAAIGIIIIVKQFPVMLGVKPESKSIFGIMSEIPSMIANMNVHIAAIGFFSLIILFFLPMIKNQIVKKIPAPMVVILIAIPLGIYFDLAHEHTFTFLSHIYHEGPEYLVKLPNSIMSGITAPDFSKIFTGTSIQYIVMFALVGSLESVLSSKAIDTLDPWKRKTNYNRDLLAVGVGNTLAGMIGGLPMISEIVRSSANINNGAKSSWSNFFHGLFLFVFVAFLPFLIQKIPLAALAAMLVYTGFRLASPKEFSKTYKIGKEQLAIFLVTIFFTLYEDLLVGIAAGIVAKLLVQIIIGVPFKSMFKAFVNVKKLDEEHYRVNIEGSATYTNYIGIKKHLLKLPAGKHVEINLENCKVIDHTALENIHVFEMDYRNAGGTCHSIGYDNHKALSKHELAVRIKK